MALLIVSSFFLTSRSPLSLLNRPPCNTAHSGNSSTEAIPYAVNRF